MEHNLETKITNGTKKDHSILLNHWTTLINSFGEQGVAGTKSVPSWWRSLPFLFDLFQPLCGKSFLYLIGSRSLCPNLYFMTNCDSFNVDGPVNQELHHKK